jgi:hypothetical protein
MFTFDLRDRARRAFTVASQSHDRAAQAFARRLERDLVQLDLE